MREEIKREFFPQDFQAPSSWPAMAFVFLWGLAFGSAVLMAPLVPGLFFGVVGWGASLGVAALFLKAIAGTRRGVSITSRGIREHLRLAPDRFVPWSEVTAVERASTGASIRTQRGDITIGDDLSAWPVLVRRVEMVLGEEAEEDEGDLVSPDEVREWLGLAPGEVLWCRAVGSAFKAWSAVPLWALVTGLLCAFYAPFFWGALTGGFGPGAVRIGALLFTTAHASIFFGVFSGGLLMKVIQAFRAAYGKAILADATGLTFGGARGRHVSWGELQSATLRDGRWHIGTEHETFVIEPGLSNLGRLVQAIQQAVAAREAGRRLPRLGPVPAGAISIARERSLTADGVDRGISLAEEGSDSLDAEA